MQREIGLDISHYRLERLLGTGGMGEVWLAEDRALGRRVALKLLRDELSEMLRARLRREAEASARLHHPGIATLYESGEDHETTWLALEYVDGETLRARLKRGALPSDEALSLGATLLEALVHAHTAGVLHRDVKPENVMFTDGRVAKLLDFGLAKWIEEQVDPLASGDAATATAITELTAHGTVAGTLGYMSPEQLRGDAVDARTDVFAAGAVVYEALCGQVAFPGATTRERIAAILSRDPDPLVSPGLPPGLDEVLFRAMKRDADERYPDASSFLTDLRRASEGRAVAELPPTLAVLDLDNVSGNADDDWIGTGVAESLAADLGRAAGLKLLPREKVMSVRANLATGGHQVDPVQVGRMLGCRWVLAGGVQRIGPSIRVTTRLCETGTGGVVATEKIDGRLDDIFGIQDRLSNAVAESLDLTAATTRQSPDLDAFECYNRGRALLMRMGKGRLEQAREYYERAIELDPGYVPALAELAMMHAVSFIYTTDPRVLDTASDCARRALAREPNNGTARAWHGYSLWRQGHLEEALEEEKRATRLDPDNYMPHYFAGTILCHMGRPGEALRHLQRSVECFPEWAWGLAVLGWCHLLAGRFSEARWSFEKAVAERHRPGALPYPGAPAAYAECLRIQHELPAARKWAMLGLEEIEQSDHPYRDMTWGGSLVVLGRVALDQGDMAAAKAAFGQAVAQCRGRSRGIGAGHVMVQALAGLTRAGAGAEPFEEGLQLFEEREAFDFSWVLVCSEEISLFQLARAAAKLDRTLQAAQLLQASRQAGLSEALERDA